MTGITASPAQAGHWRGRALTVRAMRLGGAVDWRLLCGPGPGILAHFPALVGYLEEVRPRALLAFGTQCNLAALWAERLVRSGVRIVVSGRNVLSAVVARSRRGFRHRYLSLVRRNYPEAAAVVTVSDAIARDLEAGCGLAAARLTTTPNPVSMAEQAAAAEPLDHPWLAPGTPPVLLAAGRLHPQKDFATLLQALARGLGIADAVAAPGFVVNPFAWMARTRLLVLTSRIEGFGNVLIEALQICRPWLETDQPVREALAFCPHAGFLTVLADAQAGRPT